jgi:hypothetical protein
MVRTIWLSLFCLIGVGAMGSLKIAMTQTTRAQVSLDQPTIGTAFEPVLLDKADKLQVAYAEDVPEKKLVTTIAITLPKVAAHPSEKITKIISRHWHEVLAKRLTGHSRETPKTQKANLT